MIKIGDTVRLNSLASQIFYHRELNDKRFKVLDIRVSPESGALCAQIIPGSKELWSLSFLEVVSSRERKLPNWF